MNKIEQDIRKMQELQKEYEDHIYERLDQYIRLTGFDGNDFYIDKWEFNGDTIDIEFTQHGYRGWYESASRTMPIEYLWDENWLENTKEIVERKKEEDRIVKEQEDDRKKKAQEKRDRAKFEELKKRFGGDE